jgi:hypothetical protein
MKYAVWVLSVTIALTCLSGCGQRTQPGRSARVAPPSPPSAPAFGLTEDNADLLWSPGATQAPGGVSFRAARRALTALHPRYLRLLVDWAALQPERARAPELEAMASGCARAVGPCGAYAGIRTEFESIASQQRAARAEGQAGFQVVIDIFGTPAWAADAPSGCELADTRPFSRPVTPAGIAAYRTLIRSLLVLGAHEGVALEWWSPWNEPNDPVFVSPQRASCAVESLAISPNVYAQLAAAMVAQLKADGGIHHLLLGELNAYQTDSPHRTSIAAFVAALPADVVCLSNVWSLHAYAARRNGAPSAGPVKALEMALDARGACGREARIWITEAGAGAPHPGRARPAGAADERDSCLALAGQLAAWYDDPRVEAVFQYTFREDPAFPVGLISADLSHLYPTYNLWFAFTRARARGAPPPSPAVACA